VLLFRASLDSFLSTSDHHKISTAGSSYGMEETGTFPCIKSNLPGLTEARTPHIEVVRVHVHHT
jgi:hypothetical protein